MKDHLKRRWRVGAVLGIVVAALGTAVYAFAAASGPPATTVGVCIKPNGQLRVLTQDNPACVEPERAADWTVNGVKQIETGAGLIGRSSDGNVSLELDPGLIANANSGKIVAGFDDGPHSIPDGNAESRSVIAQLPVPAGAYAIMAKLNLIYFGGEEQFSPVTCRLQAGADFDDARVIDEGFHFEESGIPEGTSDLTMSLEVVHRFEAPSRVFLSCADGFPPVGGHVSYQDLKLIAIGGSSLTNAPLPPVGG
jgi:hypothetical protein